MYRILISLFLLFLSASHSHALFWRAFASLTGDVAGSVDHAECDDLGTGLDDGMGMVVTSTGDVYFYYFDRSATDATSSPDYIRCKDAAFTEGVWILASTGGGGSGTVDTSGTPLANDYARFTDANTIEGRDPATEVLTDLGLVIGTNVQADLDVPSQAEAEAGTATTERVWTAQRVSQAIAALAAGAGDVTAASPFGTDNVLVKSDGTGKGVQATGITISDENVINATGSPQHAMYDTDAAGADLADKLTCVIKANLTDTTEDAEYGDFFIDCVINGSHIESLRFDSSERAWKHPWPSGAVKRIIDVNTGYGESDYVVTTQLGSNLEDWNGVTLAVAHSATPSEQNYDVVIPDCATSYTINGSSQTISDFGAQITICQKWQGQTVQVVSASAGDDFKLRDNTNLADGNELNSPGDERTFMCVTLACLGASDRWQVIDETGCYSNGTDLIDCEWVDGGSAD